MIRAVFFDMGGTLDGDGLHWLDRFLPLYAESGLTLPRETIRAAFDAAERRAATDDGIASARLAEMVGCHVAWQFAHLGLTDDRRRAMIVDKFVEEVREAARTNAALLADCASRQLRLGIVSNGCGNVDVLCRELGYAPYLSMIVDSRRVGLFKPDPAIYTYAVSALGVAAADALMVGDSFERDVRPAKSIGMRTAWLEGPRARSCPDPSLVDIRLRRLADLSAVLPSGVPSAA